MSSSVHNVAHGTAPRTHGIDVYYIYTPIYSYVLCGAASKGRVFLLKDCCLAMLTGCAMHSTDPEVCYTILLLTIHNGMHGVAGRLRACLLQQMLRPPPAEGVPGVPDHIPPQV